MCGTDSPFLSQICSGLEPIEYKMDRKPAWYVLRNIVDGEEDGVGRGANARARSQAREEGIKREMCVVFFVIQSAKQPFAMGM